MMSTVSLDARIFDSGNYRTPPVAPPRKKRSTLKKGSTLPTTFSGGNVVHNGFKEVFSNGGTARALTYDDIEYIDREDSAFQTRAAVEYDGGSLERKLKVGNKKTDKFFGESLSDHLSDEPVTSVEAPPKLDKDETDRSSTSDKKLYFLMNMLEQDMNDEEKYKDRVPVDEPLFVARKKEIKKHICDDDDHMHAHFHKHDNEASDHAVAPPKPDRDFSKYHSNPVEAELHHLSEDEIAEKIIESHSRAHVRKALSRENLPTPPDAPKRKSGYASVPNTPTITIESIDFNTSGNSEIFDEHKSEKRPPSLVISKGVDEEEENDDLSHHKAPTTPILPHNVVDHMIKKAYGFHDYHPEDFTEHNHDDGSLLVAPTSKLTTRKISVGRKVSTNM